MLKKDGLHDVLKDFRDDGGYCYASVIPYIRNISTLVFDYWDDMTRLKLRRNIGMLEHEIEQINETEDKIKRRIVEMLGEYTFTIGAFTSFGSKYSIYYIQSRDVC